jgi:hypothetical protein
VGQIKTVEQMPLSLTDAQLTQVTNATRPLELHQRNALLAALPYVFAGRSTVRDGELARALRELGREHFLPPRLHNPAGHKPR